MREVAGDDSVSACAADGELIGQPIHTAVAWAGGTRAKHLAGNFHPSPEFATLK
jgi:hypothetical protein